VILPQKPPPSAEAFVGLARSAGAYEFIKALGLRDNTFVPTTLAGVHYLAWLAGVLNYALADFVESMAEQETPA
jgi:hypothetical protein